MFFNFPKFSFIQCIIKIDKFLTFNIIIIKVLLRFFLCLIYIWTFWNHFWRLFIFNQLVICVQWLDALASLRKIISAGNFIWLCVAYACFCISRWHNFINCIFGFQMINVISFRLLCRQWGSWVNSIEDCCVLIFQHWSVPFLFLFYLEQFICVVGIYIWSNCHALNSSWLFSLLNPEFLIRIRHLPCSRLPQRFFRMHYSFNFIKSFSWQFIHMFLHKFSKFNLMHFDFFIFFYKNLLIITYLFFKSFYFSIVFYFLINLLNLNWFFRSSQNCILTFEFCYCHLLWIACGWSTC